MTIANGKNAANKYLNDLSVSGLHYEAAVNIHEYLNEDKREPKFIDTMYTIIIFTLII